MNGGPRNVGETAIFGPDKRTGSKHDLVQGQRDRENRPHHLHQGKCVWPQEPLLRQTSSEATVQSRDKWVVP